MLCPACLLVLSMAATNQLANNVALVAGTRLVNLKASAATFVIPKKLWPSRELHNKSAIYFFRYLCCLLMVCLLCKREGERMSQKEKDKKER